MGQRMFHHPDAPRIGDYALFDGNRGRVKEVHIMGPTENIGIGQDVEDREFWMRANHITEDERKETWISILCHGGGSVVGPASRFKKIEPFPFENSWACEYFSDALTGDEEWIGPRNF